MFSAAIQVWATRICPGGSWILCGWAFAEAIVAALGLA